MSSSSTSASVVADTKRLDCIREEISKLPGSRRLPDDLITEAMTLLSRSGPLSTSAANFGLSINSIIVDRNQEDTSRLMKAGAVDAIVTTFRAHPDSLVVAYSGCGAVRMVGIDEFDAEKFFKAGAIPLVITAMKKFIGHPEKDFAAGIADWGAGALWNMAKEQPDAHKQIAELGGIELLLAAMRQFPRDKSVVSQSVGALFHITSLMAENCSRAKRAGAIDLLSRVSTVCTLPIVHSLIGNIDSEGMLPLASINARRESLARAARLTQTAGRTSTADEAAVRTNTLMVSPLTAGRFCDCCDHRAGTKRCTRCLTVAYCSKECQRADWRRHRRTCGFYASVNPELQAKESKTKSGAASSVADNLGGLPSTPAGGTPGRVSVPGGAGVPPVMIFPGQGDGPAIAAIPSSPGSTSSCTTGLPHAVAAQAAGFSDLGEFSRALSAAAAQAAGFSDVGEFSRALSSMASGVPHGHSEPAAAGGSAGSDHSAATTTTAGGVSGTPGGASASASTSSSAAGDPGSSGPRSRRSRARRARARRAREAAAAAAGTAGDAGDAGSLAAGAGGGESMSCSRSQHAGSLVPKKDADLTFKVWLAALLNDPEDYVSVHAPVSCTPSDIVASAVAQLIGSGSLPPESDPTKFSLFRLAGGDIEPILTNDDVITPAFESRSVRLFIKKAN